MTESHFPLSTQWVDRQPSAPIHFVLAALAGVAKQGGDIQALLTKANIAPGLINNPQARVTARQFSKIIPLIIAQLEDEFMGLGEVQTPIGTFELMAFGTVHCKNLGEATERAARFYRVMLGEPELYLQQRGSKAVLRLAKPQGKQQAFLVEALLTVMHRFMCWLVGERIAIDALHLNYPTPDHQNEYYGLFGKQIVFDQEHCEMIFSAECLQWPVVRTAEQFSEFMDQAPLGFLMPPQYEQSTQARIRQLLAADIEQGFPTLEELAASMNTTTSTLSRRMQSEDTSYQSIKDSLRRDMAMHYLTATSLPVAEISHLLGYKDVSVFHRSFKKWTGATPGAYRENLAE